MSNINETLLKELFASKTKFLDNTYKNLKGRIFYGIEDYVNFLQLKDPNEKLEAAKNIIKRICFESNFPPPHKLLFNIVKQETDIENRSENEKYIGQDHFIHKVNLYILGIYMFLKHPSFSKELKDTFIDKRKNEPLRALNSVKDFISSWKYFCFYHDIAYPIEIYYKREELTSEQEKELSIYNNLFEMSCTELIIEAITKLVTLNCLGKDKKNKTLYELLTSNGYKFKNVNNNKILEEADEDYLLLKDYTRIAKLYNFESLKMFLGFVQKNDYISVLFLKQTGQPIAFYTYEGSGDDKKIYININIDTHLTLSFLNSIFDCSDIDKKDTWQYEIKYYFKDFNKIFENCLKEYGHNLMDSILIKDIENLSKLIVKHNTKQIRFERIINETDLRNFMFSVYTFLFEYYDNLFEYYTLRDLSMDNEINLPILYSLNKRYCYDKYVETDLKDNLKKVISDNILNTNNLDKLSKTLSKSRINRETIKEHLSNFITASFEQSKIEKIEAEIISTATKGMEEELIQEISMMDSSIRIFVSINKLINKLCSEMKYDKGNCVNSKEFNLKLLYETAQKNLTMKTIIQDINNSLLDKKHVSINDIIEKYKGFTLYDHGICSGIIYLYINSIHTQLAEALIADKSNKYTSFLSLFWSIDPRIAKNKLIYNYGHIRKETGSSILCHNIYADKAKESFDFKSNEKWIFKIENEAFQYFSILCDSLQHWDRRKFYNYNKFSYGPLMAMDEYDINVKGDIICINALSYTQDYIDIIKKFDFDSFLADCSSYISIDISRKYI